MYFSASTTCVYVSPVSASCCTCSSVQFSASLFSICRTLSRPISPFSLISNLSFSFLMPRNSSGLVAVSSLMIPYWHLTSLSGYTHLVDSFSYKRDKTGIDVGWGKYYGPMLEHGTKKMSAKAHLKPLFEQNKERYYKKMIAALDL